MRRFLLLLAPLCLCSIHGFSTFHFSHTELPAVKKDTAKKGKDTADGEVIKHREFEFSLEGANDQSRYGLRNKDLKLPYLEPGFTYTAKNGLYIGITDQYLILKNSKGGFDVFGLNPGWNWDVADNTTINFNFQYYHFRKGSPNVIRSSLFSDLETYVDQYIYKELEGRLTIDYDIYSSKGKQQSTPNDIVFTPDLLYTFNWDFGKKSSITVIPEVNMDFGTRNFYTQYQIAAASDSTSKGLKPKKQQYSSNANSSFGVLDYNFILTLEYSVGEFSFEPAITYNHPLYTPVGSSTTPPTVFGSITLSYTIKSKK